MQARLKKLVFVLASLVVTGPALAEKGFLHEGTDPGSVLRTDYGECWTTIYRDAGLPIDPSCVGDADMDGVADSMDKCPDTPKDTQVDEVGCPLDADGDGVTDDLDACPNTPQGTKVDAKGCPLDADGDGVADDMDKCPGTPQGAKVDAQGCADSDSDGVTDNADKCPGTLAGAQVNSMGCAVEIVLANVQFELNKGVLTSDSKDILDQVAASLQSRSDIQSIVVVGHTDSSGAAAYNQSLSEKRAKTVADYLQSQGVERSKLTSMGMGEAQPIADNGTSAGRAMNRRVELQVK